MHRTVSSFHCVSKGCGKSFKSSNELNRHTQKHLGVTWECKEWDYLTDDRQNLHAHSKNIYLLVSTSVCLATRVFTISCNSNDTEPSQSAWEMPLTSENLELYVITKLLITLCILLFFSMNDTCKGIMYLLFCNLT